MKIEVDLRDLNEMLFIHARWSMERQTFSSYISSDLIKRYFKYLSLSQKESLLKNIKNELDNLKSNEASYSSIGKTNTCSWEQLIQTLESKMTPEESGD